MCSIYRVHSRRHIIEILCEKFTYIGETRIVNLQRAIPRESRKIAIVIKREPVETKCEPSNFGRSYSPIPQVIEVLYSINALN